MLATVGVILSLEQIPVNCLTVVSELRTGVWVHFMTHCWLHGHTYSVDHPSRWYHISLPHLQCANELHILIICLGMLFGFNPR